MRILAVVSTLKKGGGISEWVIRYYRQIMLKHDVQVTICVENNIDDFDDAVELPEFEVVHLHKMTSNPITYLMDWSRLMRKINDFDFVHFHTDNFVKFVPYFLLRRHSNIVVHAHNSTNLEVEASKIKSLMHRIGKNIVSKSRFYRFACSDFAAEWLYGDKDYFQVNNGVNLQEMAFKEHDRLKMRGELGLHGKTVFGHVGRFVEQKNQKRLVEIFERIHAKKPETELVLVGTGRLEDDIKEQVKIAGLTNCVQFLGFRQDIKKLVNAFDCIIFPSLYEGLPMALVEAQANGIPVFFADTITQEVALLPQSQSFSLADSNSTISKQVLTSIDKKKLNRAEASQILFDEGYDESTVAEQLFSFYRGNNVFEHCHTGKAK